MKCGQSLLIKNINESLNPLLRSLLKRRIFSRDNKLYARVGKLHVEYHPNFKLYLTTKIPKPNISVEVAKNVVIIDCSITESMLQEQLLA